MEKIPIENNDATLSEDAVAPVTTTDAPPSEGCDGSGSSINNKHTKRGRYGRAPPSSQAKRRLEAMATGIDYKLAAAFTTILILYTVITLGMWKSLELQTFRHEVIEQTTENSISQQHDYGNSNNDHGINSNRIEISINKPSIRAEDITDIETLQHTFPQSPLDLIVRMFFLMKQCATLKESKINHSLSISHIRLHIFQLFLILTFKEKVEMVHGPMSYCRLIPI